MSFSGSTTTSPAPSYFELPPSPTTQLEFSKALFQSTLGARPSFSLSPPPTPRGAPTLPPSPTLVPTPTMPSCFSATPSCFMMNSPNLANASSAKSLDRQLFLFTLASILLLTTYFFTPASLQAHLPPTLLHAGLSYVTLLLTFRSGVGRLACDEMELTGASQLTAGEGVAVQGITLLAAAALMHLPVGVLQEFSIVVGLAAWAFTTCLIGMLMWDAIRRTTGVEFDEEACVEDFMVVDGGYIAKA